MNQKSKDTKIAQFDVYSEEVREVLTNPPRMLLLSGNYIVLLLLIIGIFLAWLIKFPDSIVSPGTITSSVSPIKLLAQTNGNLNLLNVKDGASIEKDAVLGVISINESYEDILILENFLNEIKDNYRYENVDQYEKSELSLGDLTAAFNELISLLKQHNVITDQLSVKGEIKAYEKQISEYDLSKVKISEEKRLAEQRLELTRQNHKRQEELFAKGLISKYDLEQSEYELNSNQSTIATIDTRLQELNSTAQVTRRQIISIQTNENRDIAELQFQINKTLNGLMADINKWRSNHVILAPSKGICSFATYLETNQYVNHEQDLFYISPDTSEFEIRGVLPFEKSGLVEIGNQVIVRLSQYPHQQYGTLQGQIKKITYTPSEDGYFFVAQLNNGNVTTYKKQIALKPLMPAQLEIIIQDARLIERIFYEIKNIFEN